MYYLFRSNSAAWLALVQCVDELGNERTETASPIMEYISAHTCTHMCARLHAHMHTHTYILSHTHTCTHTDKHTHILSNKTKTEIIPAFTLNTKRKKTGTYINTHKNMRLKQFNQIQELKQMHLKTRDVTTNSDNIKVSRHFQIPNHCDHRHMSELTWQTSRRTEWSTSWMTAGCHEWLASSASDVRWSLWHNRSGHQLPR